MNKHHKLKHVLAFLLGIVVTTSILFMFKKEDQTAFNQQAYLSQPIASEKLLITSAGQSTDTYIIKDVANDLLLENIFIPHAETSDLEDVNSVVIVVAHSQIGETLQDIDFDDEYLRVQTLIEETLEKDLPIIGVYIGGQLRDNNKTNQLIELVFSSSSYNFVVGKSDQFTNKDTKFSHVPMIYVEDIRQIKGPFSSLFR
jgi:hypothetical protein